MVLLMKAIFTADWHLTNSLPYSKRAPDDLVSDRLTDLVKALDFVFHSAQDRGLPLFVLGDIFDRRQPDAVALKAAASLFGSAARLGARVYILPGNHDAYDTRGLHYSVEAFAVAGLKNVRVLEEGVIEEVDGVSFCPVPSQSVKASIELIGKYRDEKTDGPKILLLHDTIVGSRLSGGHVAEDGISKDDLVGFDYVLAGHVHEFQTLDPVKGCYVGSPFQMNFNEVGHEPSIGMLTSEAKRVAFHRIKVPADLSQCFGETVFDSAGDRVERGHPEPKYHRTIFEGDEESLDVQRDEVDRVIAEKASDAREATFIHRGGPSTGRGRFDVNVVTGSVPPLSRLVRQYAEIHRETDAEEHVKAGLEILREL
jgi:DNA repair exonuclease SbcCD nuclease subunit